MSLVGPRPCLPYETEYFAPHHFERFLTPPGITGLWQVTARAHAGFPEALDGHGGRAELVDRPRCVASSPDPGGGPSAKEGDGLMTLLKRAGGRLEQDTVSANGAGSEDARVRVRVVGLGYWAQPGSRHPRVGCGGDRLDLRPTHGCACRSRAALPAVRQTQDIDDLLADETVDAVAVVTPVSTHRPGDARAQRRQARIRRETAGFLVGSRRRFDRCRVRPRPRVPATTFLCQPPVNRIRELIRAGSSGTSISSPCPASISVCTSRM